MHGQNHITFRGGKQAAVSAVRCNSTEDKRRCFECWIYNIWETESSLFLHLAVTGQESKVGHCQKASRIWVGGPIRAYNLVKKL